MSNENYNIEEYIDRLVANLEKTENTENVEAEEVDAIQQVIEHLNSQSSEYVNRFIDFMIRRNQTEVDVVGHLYEIWKIKLNIGVIYIHSGEKDYIASRTYDKIHTLN